MSTTVIDGELVNKKTGEVVEPPRYTPPKLNKAGMECPSPISLVCVPALRDFDLGHRIARYQRTPESVQARLDEQYDDDDVDFDQMSDEDTNPMSAHELRFSEAQQELSDKVRDRIKKEDDAKAAKRKADTLALQADLERLKKEGATPPADPPENTA